MRVRTIGDDAPGLQRRGAILDVPVDPVDRRRALACIRAWLEQPDGALHHIVTVNPEFAIAARRDPVFRSALWGSSLATADGVGIVLAGGLLGVQVGERVTGLDLIEGLGELATPACRLFLLGAAEGVAIETSSRLRKRYPALTVSGAHSGSPSDAAWPEIASLLDASGPTVLLVAFGHPRQDLWIAAHRVALAERGVRVAIGVGGAFDYISGRVPRAPRWVRSAGLEWLYRLIRQPWRWRRQLALPEFVVLVLWERIRRR